MKHIRKRNEFSFNVCKNINGRFKSFGSYPTLETAQRVRDELIKVNWDMNQYQEIRNRLRQEGVQL